MSDTVITVLKDESKMPPIPGIQDAARTAVIISGAAQGARNNKKEFKHLGEESCRLVYEVIRMHETASRAEEVPAGVVDNVKWLVDTLKSTEEFVQKTASRNKVKTFLDSLFGAPKIQSYQEKLEKCSRALKLQFKSSLQNTVAELAANQQEMKERLTKAARECDGINGAAQPVDEDSNSPFNPDDGNMNITAVRGDMMSGEVFKTTRNARSFNTMTNATVNDGNTTTVVTNTFTRGRG